MGQIDIIGAGPAGLMAAEILASGGHAVTIHERMPSPARKFLMAGRGGLNLTHSEPAADFVERYNEAADWLHPMLSAFSPADVVAWAEGLGQPTFVGSSGRIFPRDMKASPLLRAWLHRLESLGVAIRPRTQWIGWNDSGQLLLRGDDGTTSARDPDAVLLALGGASWPRLGARGDWTELLTQRGVALSPFRPANSGFTIGWSPTFKRGFAGTPLKGIGLSFGSHKARGEVIVTEYGLEGGAIYALSAPLREAIDLIGTAVLSLDLRPDRTLEQLVARLSVPAPGQSTANRLRKALHLPPVAINLMREAHGVVLPRDPETLAVAVKAVRLHLLEPGNIAKAISSAGGIQRDALDERLMLRAIPGVFAAGEMIDWEAPTGGYLLQACFSTGVAAARGIIDWLDRRTSR